VDEQRARAARGERYVIRFAMPTEGFIRVHDALRGVTDFDAATQDDFIALKSDGFPTYHLAAMVDDHDMRSAMCSAARNGSPRRPSTSACSRRWAGSRR
jgi:glutamyl/glutaminyl-tRNA synthetase